MFGHLIIKVLRIAVYQATQLWFNVRFAKRLVGILREIAEIFFLVKFEFIKV